MDGFYKNDFASRDVLRQYGSNALMLYALQLKYGIDDIETVASDSLTDGSDDKKCDMIYINEEDGSAVIAQSYYSNNNNQGHNKTAPSNKASDLNTAAAWVLTAKESEIPEILRSGAIALRDAIKNNKISILYLWYVHNLMESDNVAKELERVENTAKSILETNYPDNNVVVNSLEIGDKRLSDLYSSTKSVIVVNDQIEFDTGGKYFYLEDNDWSAYQTFITGKRIYDIYKKYQDKLFSANPRRFLGMGKRKNIINLGIRDSAKNSPNEFWTYNNGITALVNDFSFDNSLNKLKVTGISIINGAQTTGAIGILQDAPNECLKIPIRFIKCKKQNIIENIVANNNKQNEMLPSDFRSNDICQTKLRAEFKKSEYFYSGGLRSSETNSNLVVLDPGVVAQSLIAFDFLDPYTAYSNKVGLWENESLYSKIFNDHTTAKHIIFTATLSKAIDKYKLHLKDNRTTLSSNENNVLHDFLQRRGSRILLLSAISNLMEPILNQNIPNKQKLHFKDSLKYSKIIGLWELVIAPVSLQYEHLLSSMTTGGIDKTKVPTSLKEITSLLSSIMPMLRTQLKDFIDAVEIS